MKVIGNEEDKYPKKKIVAIAIIVLVILAIPTSIYFYKSSANDKQLIAEKEKELDDNNIDSESIGKYKEAGIDLEDEEALAERKAEASEKLNESIDSDDIGDIVKESTQEERYKGVSVSEEMDKIIQESRKENSKGSSGSSASSDSSGSSSSSKGGSASSSGASGGSSNSNSGGSSSGNNWGSSNSGSSNGENSDSKDLDEDDGRTPPEDDKGIVRPENENNTTEDDLDDDRLGETIDDDLDNIEKLIASATLEVRTTTRIVKDTINNNLTNNSDVYNSTLLQETLDRNSSGDTSEGTGIDNLTYGDFFNITKHWLFYYPEDEFSWKMIDQTGSLYNSFLSSKAYNKDFSSISSQVINIIDDGTEMDSEYVSFSMIFYSNGSAYKGVFSIQDNMPRLLDLSTL